VYCKRFLIYFKNGTSQIVWGFDKQQLYEKYRNARSVFLMGKK